MLFKSKKIPSLLGVVLGGLLPLVPAHAEDTSQANSQSTSQATAPQSQAATNSDTTSPAASNAGASSSGTTDSSATSPAPANAGVTSAAAPASSSTSTAAPDAGSTGSAAPASSATSTAAPNAGTSSSAAPASSTTTTTTSSDTTDTTTTNAANSTTTNTDTASSDQTNSGQTTAKKSKTARAKLKDKDQPQDKATPPAKDTAPPQPPTWDGLYIGAFGGAGWGDSSLNSGVGGPTPTSYFLSSADVDDVSRNATGSVHASTGILGLQIANNVQSGRVVYGAAIDVSSFRISGSHTTTANYPGSTSQYFVKSYMSTSWLASLRARVGIVPSDAWPLIYLTGGVAITNIQVYNAFNDNTFDLGVGGSTSRKVKAGGIVGLGVEVPFKCKSWTVDAEYDFVSFGSNTANGYIGCGTGTCGGARSPFSTSANLNASIVRVGINYKLS